MKLPHRRNFLHLAAGAAALPRCRAAALPNLPRTARAQAYPTRAVTMITPFAAGGPTDTYARVVSGQMARVLRQPFVIENVSGAGGTTGASRRLLAYCGTVPGSNSRRRAVHEPAIRSSSPRRCRPPPRIGAPRGWRRRSSGLRLRWSWRRTNRRRRTGWCGRAGCSCRGELAAAGLREECLFGCRQLEDLSRIGGLWKGHQAYLTAVESLKLQTAPRRAMNSRRLKPGMGAPSQGHSGGGTRRARAV